MTTSNDQIANHYKKKVYGKEHLHMGVKERLVTELLPVGEKLKILDIGCGPGRLLAHLSSLGHNAQGIDISEASCEEAKSRNLNVQQGSVEDLPKFGFGNKSFDVVLFLDVLEHTFSPESAVKLALPLLKDGGTIIVSVPNIANVVGRTTLLSGKWPLNETGLFDRGHLRCFTLENLQLHFGKVATVDQLSLKPLPLEPIYRFGLGRLQNLQSAMLIKLARCWPSLWAFEFVFKLQPGSDSIRANDI